MRDPKDRVFWSGLLFPTAQVLGVFLEGGARSASVGGPAGAAFRVLAALAMLGFASGLAWFCRRMDVIDEVGRAPMGSPTSDLVRAAGVAGATLLLAGAVCSRGGSDVRELGASLTAGAAAPLGVMCIAAAPKLMRARKAAAAAGLFAYVAGVLGLVRAFGAMIFVDERGKDVAFLDPTGIGSGALGLIVGCWVVTVAVALKRTDLDAVT